ncbi:Fanconi anemia group A protein [Lamellibrachia satsuma]|nr:Fanconi anemia group A protein [Lamellibrachia satsuma]
MSFSAFLEHCASSRDVSPSDVSGTAWKDAVVELVVRYQDLDRLLQEAAESEEHILTSPPDEDRSGNTEVWQSLSVDSIVAVVHQRAAISSNPLPLTAASVCASKVKDIITATNQDGAALLLSKQTKGKLDVFLQVIARLQQDQAFSTKVFIKILNKQISLPIGLVWRLHDSGVMPLDAYIACNLSQPTVIGSLATDIARLCETGDEHSLPHRKAIISDLVGCLVQHGYQTALSDDATARGMKKVSCALLDSIAKKVLIEGTDRDITLHSLPHTTSAQGDSRVLKAFFTRQLSVILSLNPLLKVSEALTMQSQWTYSRTPSYLAGVYKQLLSVFSAREAVDILQNVLEIQEVNWQAVLSFTASLLVCFPGAPTLLQELISTQLSRAFETCELDGIITAFLLARQGCLEGAHVFPSYQRWFQTMFGSPPTSPATSKKTFAFLIKFLTDVVPFETALYLKAHVLSPPFVPAKCRVILTDYITLAKTRLSDLGESMEEVGIYEEGQSRPANMSEREKASSLAEQDVDKALSAFKKTGKVPASVMEASIFRKPYFVGRFLPSLLAPRPLPDVPDIRMKFIEVLHNSDKITAPLYQKYSTMCAHLSAQLLEGVSELEDEMEDLLLPPLEQLQLSLDSLQRLVGQSDNVPAHGTHGGGSVVGQ